MNISPRRLQELEAAENKLDALERAGVDNWEGYDIAMEEILRKQEINEKIKDSIDEVLTLIQESGYEPSERGAGFTIPEDKYYEAAKLLKECLDGIIG